VRDLLATTGPFVLLATGPARSDVAEFGARISSVAPSRPCCLAARARPKASMSAPVVRREIESGDVRSVVDRLLTQFRDPQAIWRYRGQLTLVIDGYNQDPRELVDIREVRSFLQEFDRHWPYRAFFFNQVDDSLAPHSTQLPFWTVQWAIHSGRGQASMLRPAGRCRRRTSAACPAQRPA